MTNESEAGKVMSLSLRHTFTLSFSRLIRSTQSCAFYIDTYASSIVVVDYFYGLQLQ